MAAAPKSPQNHIYTPVSWGGGGGGGVPVLSKIDVAEMNLLRKCIDRDNYQNLKMLGYQICYTFEDSFLIVSS